MHISLTTTGLKKKLVLWVLEDAEKHKWSKSIFVLSHLYNEKIGHKCYIVGITSAGEIVFMPVGHVNPNFHLFFYNMERDTCTTVNIKGFEEFKHHSLHITTYLDYVENMMPLWVCSMLHNLDFYFFCWHWRLENDLMQKKNIFPKSVGNWGFLYQIISSWRRYIYKDLDNMLWCWIW